MGRHKGFKRSEESKLKQSLTNIGHICDDSTKLKMSLANKRKEPWNKGKKGLYSHTEESKYKLSILARGKNKEDTSFFGKHHTKESRQKISITLKGRHYQTEESRLKISIANKRRIVSEKTRQKMSLAAGGDGIHFLSNDSDYPLDYYRKRYEVYKRDRHTCQECNKNTGFIDIHHIDKNKENNNLDNLVVLCRKCHSQKHHIRR